MQFISTVYWSIYQIDGHCIVICLSDRCASSHRVLWCLMHKIVKQIYQWKKLLFLPDYYERNKVTHAYFLIILHDLGMTLKIRLADKYDRLVNE